MTAQAPSGAELELLRQQSIQVLASVADALEAAAQQRQSLQAEVRAAEHTLLGLVRERDLVAAGLAAMHAELREASALLQVAQQQRVDILREVEQVLSASLAARETLQTEVVALERRRDELAARDRRDDPAIHDRGDDLAVHDRRDDLAAHDRRRDQSIARSVPSAAVMAELESSLTAEIVRGPASSVAALPASPTPAQPPPLPVNLTASEVAAALRARTAPTLTAPSGHPTMTAPPDHPTPSGMAAVPQIPTRFAAPAFPDHPTSSLDTAPDTTTTSSVAFPNPPAASAIFATPALASSLAFPNASAVSPITPTDPTASSLAAAAENAAVSAPPAPASGLAFLDASAVYATGPTTSSLVAAETNPAVFAPPASASGMAALAGLSAIPPITRTLTPASGQVGLPNDPALSPITAPDTIASGVAFPSSPALSAITNANPTTIAGQVAFPNDPALSPITAPDTIASGVAVPNAPTLSTTTNANPTNPTTAAGQVAFPNDAARSAAIATPTTDSRQVTFLGDPATTATHATDSGQLALPNDPVLSAATPILSPAPGRASATPANPLADSGAAATFLEHPTLSDVAARPATPGVGGAPDRLAADGTAPLPTPPARSDATSAGARPAPARVHEVHGRPGPQPAMTADAARAARAEALMAELAALLSTSDPPSTAAAPLSTPDPPATDADRPPSAYAAGASRATRATTTTRWVPTGAPSVLHTAGRGLTRLSRPGLLSPRIIATAALVALLIGLILLITPVTAVFGGLQLLAMTSGSMEPRIPVGAVVGIRPVPASDLKVGDAITFANQSDPDVLVTHRVVSMEARDGQTLLTTKGDANDAVDALAAPANRAIGRVDFSLPWLGYLMIWLGSPLIRAGIVVLAVVAVGLSSIQRLKPPSATPVAADPDFDSVGDYQQRIQALLHQ